MVFNFNVMEGKLLYNLWLLKLLWSVKYYFVVMVNICVVHRHFICTLTDCMGLEPFEEVMII